MRNKFVYSCSIKIYAAGFDERLESIFCLLLFVEEFSLKKVADVLEQIIVCLARGQLSMADEAKPRRPICSTFEDLVV